MSAGPKQTFGNEDRLMQAEIREALSVAEHDLSFHGCSHNPDRYRAQFTDSKIAEKFSAKRTKLTYLATEAIGPYMKKQLADIGPYSLSWDEVS